MREDGPDEHGSQRAGDLDVLDVATLAPKEPGVFGPQGRDAEGRGRDGHRGHRPTVDRRGRHMLRTATRGLVAALILATLTVAPTASHATVGHRATIKAKPVATGLNGPSGFTFAPNGVIWYLERGTGEVHTLDPKTGANHRVFTIGGVNGAGERGAL